MSYQIVLKKSAQEDIAAHKRSGNVSLCRKIENFCWNWRNILVKERANRKC